jgi:hypothetical protein
LKFFLINSADTVIHTFDAPDAAAARVEARLRVEQDGVGYFLAVALRRIRYDMPAPTPIVTDDPA